ncbi:ABC transporter substrate-binding protein [Pseudonocardiaceae bacterium YIM PH 21723]|nr:ABC transporter substrate-binding protein [Pseudonocardiaceae bacterium YIM PH 21723]
MKRLALGLTLVMALTACGSGGGSTDLRVLLDWFPNPDHLALYTAQDKGLFAAEGVSVELTPPANPADPLKLVAAGQADLGITYEPEVLAAAEQDLPVTAVAAVIPRALNSLMAVGDSPVKSAADLAGRTVGTAGLPSDDLYLKQMIGDKPVKKVNVGSNLVASMLSGQVDATIGAYRNIEGVQLKHEGKNPLIIPVTDAGVPQYDELVLVANRDKLKNDSGYRDRVKKFIAALGKGVEAAKKDPAAARTAIQAKMSDAPKEVLTEQVDATLPLLDNPRGFGRMDPAGWQSFADWLQAGGITKKKITVGPELVTNDYLPAR